MDCKKCLEDNDNDIEKSIEALRKKGLAKASKKSDRAAIEGAVGIYFNENITAFVPSRHLEKEDGSKLGLNENVKFKIIESKKRPVSVVADSTEFRDISSVEVYQSKDQVVELLFDEDHSFDERILNEQFKF